MDRQGSVWRTKLIRARWTQSEGGAQRRAAFTLVELLVVIGIMSIIAAIVVPGFSAIIVSAQRIKSTNNLRQIATALNTFANDHDDRYPPTFGYSGGWGKWFYNDPRSMVVPIAKSKGEMRSLASYMREYIPNSDAMSCPTAPEESPELSAVWKKGESWAPRGNQYRGTYHFYWGYVGFIDAENDGRFDTIFRGAKKPGAGKRYSDLLVSDSLAYGEKINAQAYPTFTSCEMFDGAVAREESGGAVSRVNSGDNTVRAPLWESRVIRRAEIEEEIPVVRLRAAFTDGHVMEYQSTDAIRLRRSSRDDEGRLIIDTAGDPGGTSYFGPGEFFVSSAALPLP